MPVPLTPAQIAGVQGIRGHEGLTPQQIQTEADIWNRRNPDHQLNWGQLSIPGQTGLSPDQQRLFDMGITQKRYDAPGYYAEKFRRSVYDTRRPGPNARTENPYKMRLSNAHDNWRRLGNGTDVPEENMQQYERFYNNFGATASRELVPNPKNKDNHYFTGQFNSWNIHPLDPNWKPPASNAAPSPAPSPAPMQTQPPMQAPSPTPTPVQPSAPPMGKQGGLTDKQMFKVAFLAKCIEDGLTIDEIKVIVKQALHVVEKKANTYAALADLLRTVPLLGLGAGSLIAGGGYSGGKTIIGPGIHEAFKAPLPDKEDLLKEEVINEYDRQSETIKRQAELTKRRRERDRGMSGITRY